MTPHDVDAHGTTDVASAAVASESHVPTAERMVVSLNEGVGYDVIVGAELGGPQSRLHTGA